MANNSPVAAAMPAVATRILVIEDEEAIRMGLEDSLRFEGYDVITAADGTQGVDIFEREQPDLVILDLMMPGFDGFEVCRRIKAQRQEVPVIMLTAKCSEVDKVVGLELGADDYLTKPFGMRELFARVKALLRRTRLAQHAPANETDEKAPFCFSDVTIDFRTYTVSKAGRALTLSAKEFELLCFLVRRVDVPVTRDQLLDEVWGYNNYPTTRTVDNFIAAFDRKSKTRPNAHSTLSPFTASAISSFHRASESRRRPGSLIAP